MEVPDSMEYLTNLLSLASVVTGEMGEYAAKIFTPGAVTSGCIILRQPIKKKL